LTVATDTKKEYFRVGALVLGALLLRVLFWHTEWVLNPDGIYYSWLGRNLLSGDLDQGLSTYWPPFYPLLIGICWRLFGDLESAGRIISVFAGSLLVIPTYLLAREFCGKRIAMVSGVLVSFYPLLLDYSTRARSETVYSLILMTLIWLLWRTVKDPSPGRFIGVGLLVGLAYLTKPEGIFYLIIVLVGLFGLRNASGNFHLRQRVAAAIVVIVAASVVSLPYVVYLKQVTGSWTISQKHLLAFPTSSRHALLDDDGTLMDSLYAGSSVRVPRVSTSRLTVDNFSNMIYAMKGRLVNFYRHVFPGLFPPLLIGLAVLGLFHIPWNAQRWEQELYITLFLGATIAGYSWSWFLPRLMVPFLPLLLIWAAEGTQVLADWGLNSVPRHFLARLPVVRQPAVATGVVVAVVFLSVITDIRSLWRGEQQREPTEQKMAAQWIKTNSPARPLIMASGPWAAFYAEGHHLYIPRADYDTVIAYAHKKQVTYLIVDARWINKFNPNLLFLLENHVPSKDLTPVYQVNEPPQYPLVVYRLNNR
jgi:4-amino-4-deoxy-L-arabinose transferase-like glycosyltransferase